MENRCYLIEYSDNYLFRGKVEELIHKHQFQQSEITYYDLEDATLAHVLEDLDTYSFLTPQKVIVISNALFLASSDIKFSDEEINHIMKYLDNPNPDVLFIMGVVKFDERKKIVKNIKKKIPVITVNPDVMQYTKDLLKDYKVENDALLLLIDYCNNSVSKITHECEKLKMFAIDTMEIRREDIKKIVTKDLTELDTIAFDFVKYIALKDKKRMFNCYQILKENSFDIHSTIGLIESQIRLIYQVLLGKKKRMSKDEIAKYLKEHPYRIQKTLEFLPFYTENDIRNLIHKLHELDYKIKSGQIEATLGFEVFLLYI